MVKENYETNDGGIEAGEDFTLRQNPGNTKIWVCMECGNLSYDEKGLFPLTPSWTNTCTKHAVLCDRDKVLMDNGKAVAVLPNATKDFQNQLVRRNYA